MTSVGLWYLRSFDCERMDVVSCRLEFHNESLSSQCACAVYQKTELSRADIPSRQDLNPSRHRWCLRSATASPPSRFVKGAGWANAGWVESDEAGCPGGWLGSSFQFNNTTTE
ncbi:hypothetical protein Bca52824_087761 [Brassica carinata]|uniref:Uncharacterized protein n=1 Tax=Brassica carinata TaxID=52824 RepID=A0A8X7PCG6_BRACI|nr:hypothetical protein Bca52824_087761 [Brassica carinata]